VEAGAGCRYERGYDRAYRRGKRAVVRPGRHLVHVADAGRVGDVLDRRDVARPLRVGDAVEPVRHARRQLATRCEAPARPVAARPGPRVEERAPPGEHPRAEGSRRRGGADASCLVRGGQLLRRRRVEAGLARRRAGQVDEARDRRVLVGQVEAHQAGQVELRARLVVRVAGNGLKWDRIHIICAPGGTAVGGVTAVTVLISI